MSISIFAQHEHHKQPAKQDSIAKVKKKAPGVKEKLPDAMPMYGYMKMTKN